MIAEFNELNAKIEKLAELTARLRSENAQLRQSNALLSAENIAFMDRLGKAQQRVEALLSKLPADDNEATSL
jgi:uncharacterized protein (TIGR02449 family)